MTTALHRPIVVTGANGFIGSHVVRRLVNDGHQVVALLRKQSRLERLRDIAGRFIPLQADFLTPDALYRQIELINPRGVFHLAASNIQSGVTASDEEVARVNIIGTVELIKALQGIDYDFFINTGSFLEYGPKDHPAREDELCQPGEFYSITKLAATLYGQAVARKHKKPIITFRIFTPYGPAVQPGRLVYELVTRALKDEPLQLTSPGTVRDFLYVDDIVDLLCEGMGRARKLGGGVFNAGSGRSTSIERLAREVLKITHSKSIINWGALPSVSYDSSLWQADMGRTFSHFAWRPRWSLIDGLKQTAEWFRSHHTGAS